MADQLTEQDRDGIAASFTEELSDWRNRNAGWTHSSQLAVYSPTRIHYRAKEDGELYKRLMVIAGYLIPKEAPAPK